jgi:hypothetical protein
LNSLSAELRVMEDDSLSSHVHFMDFVGMNRYPPPPAWLLTPKLQFAFYDYREDSSVRGRYRCTSAKHKRIYGFGGGGDFMTSPPL